MAQPHYSLQRVSTRDGRGDSGHDGHSGDRQCGDGEDESPLRRRRNTKSAAFNDSDSDDCHVYCFVPGEGIDIMVLAAYLRRLIDGTATLSPSSHPRDPNRMGYTVGASSALNREALEDLILDTKKWMREQQTRDFRRNPYDYIESDTFQDRRRKGSTVSVTTTSLARPGVQNGIRSDINDREESNRQTRRKGSTGSVTTPSLTRPGVQNRIRSDINDREERNRQTSLEAPAGSYTSHGVAPYDFASAYAEETNSSLIRHSPQPSTTRGGASQHTASRSQRHANLDNGSPVHGTSYRDQPVARYGVRA